MADSQRLILKVLAGPNAGAEAVVARRTSVGSGEAADIVLADPGLAAAHFTLLIQGASISVEVGDSPVFIKNEERRGGTFAIAPFEVIKCGITCCAVGPERGAWPAYAPADLMPGVPAPAAPRAPGAVAEGKPGTTSAPTAPVAATPAPKISGARIKDPRMWVAAGVAAALLLVLGLAPRLFAGGPVAAVALDARTIAQGLVTAANANGVTVRQDAQGRLVIDGFVDTSETQRRLRNSLRDSGLAFTYHVVNLEQQVSALRTIVGESAARLTVDPDPAKGRIEVGGFLPDAARWDTIRRIASRDIADLRPIDARIVTPASLAAETRQRFDAAGLDGSVRVDVVGAGIRISGALPADARAKVDRVVDDLKSRWSPMVKIEDATTSARPVLAAMPPPTEIAVARVTPPRDEPAGTTTSHAATPDPTRPRFTVVVAGRGAFVRDQSGRVYRVGDKLASGEIIEDIRINEIVTSRDGVTYHRKFGGVE